MEMMMELLMQEADVVDETRPGGSQRGKEEDEWDGELM
jgi:hypothetical protein